jgi:hypothetical protein
MRLEDIAEMLAGPEGSDRRLAPSPKVLDSERFYTGVETTGFEEDEACR